MWEWLLAPIDTERAHLSSMAIFWHGRVMVFIWGFIVPIVILIARFAKVLPWQKWPKELDNKLWWHSHWIIQSLAIFITIASILAVFYYSYNSSGVYIVHHVLGYSIVASGLLQGASGIFRGTKGGPTSPAKNGSWSGDHYDMSTWRLSFELLHKSVGYFTLFLVLLTIPSGMWAANAPNWMFILMFMWWVFLVLVFIILQYKGYAIDTYQAIWGPDKKHPGNKKPLKGWAMRRLPSDLPLNKEK